jgi:hypothetical protein
MPDRYWVGGSGSWNSTAKWSATSGGTSGASVPTAADNAIFNSDSGIDHYTVTVTDNATCANLTFTPEPVAGVTNFVVGNGFVIAGTFSTSFTAGNRRALFRSSTLGLTRDMRIATIGTVTDVDFRDIRVTGTGGTLTGTRIGNLQGNFGITFSAPKSCFRIGIGNWSDNQWSDTSGGAVNTNFFPLAQDTAVINQSTTAGTHTMNAAIPYVGTVDMSARTSALTLTLAAAQSIYGNWTFGSGITVTGSFSLQFFGRGTQVLTSAGKTLSGGLIIDAFVGTVELADALNMSNVLTHFSGTFDTKGYSVTIATLSSSSSSSVRAIKLGSSTLTLSGTTPISLGLGRIDNLTFDAGTSTINCSSTSVTVSASNLTFHNVAFTSNASGAFNTRTITGANTFNNLSITAPLVAGLTQVSFNGNQTINGTLTAAGASAISRIMLRSGALGTARTLTVGTLSANDCDFRDITIAGAAAGGSPTRAGNCGGNSGVNFPAPKTVYWNFAGAADWFSTAWATGSGGTPAQVNFPLAQDTAVFNNAGGASSVIVQAYNIGTVNMSARTTAMTLTTSTNSPMVYGNWLFGTGVTSSSTTGIINFVGRGTSTITSNGNSFGCPITIDCGPGTVQLASALSLISGRALTISSGTFDAVSHNVTVDTFAASAAGLTLKMGSGTWTLLGVGTVWDGGFLLSSAFYKGSANILLSNTTTSARIFLGGGASYNKLTIGGATGTSQLTISPGNNQFTELASTKTVAHTIAFGTTSQTFGKWSVTGTAGNVVTLTGTGLLHRIVGPCTSGIDYLAMGGVGFAATSLGEFYAGANSTGTAAAPVYRTAKPADSIRYWVGGTGNWSDTNRWSTSSGGGGGASIPRSHDDVVFNSLSNATDYTATVNTVTGGNRCKAMTISGPASGNVTLAGSTALIIHDDITLPATGLTRSYTGTITLSGTGAGKTINTNGVALGSIIAVDGVGAEWALAGALDNGASSLSFLNGSFDTANYSLTCGSLISDTQHSRAIAFGSSTVTVPGNIFFGTSEAARASFTVTAGTSQINVSSAQPIFSGNNQTFNNVSFTGTSITTATINGQNTFNNLSVVGRTTAGISSVSLSSGQTINGTLTLSAGTDATMRTFVRSSAIGTTRTLTCAAFSGTDADFRDITIAGAAAPVSGTRLGDCKGNAGITFVAGKAVYWRSAASGGWGSDSWAASDGGSLDITQFPLAQDTVIFPLTYPDSGSTVSVGAAYNIGTIDMSARTTNTMTLSTPSAGPSVYGNWINGTGVTLTGGAVLTFAGRGSQTITSAGRTFTQNITIDTPGGSVTLQDAFVTNRSVSPAFSVNVGVFNANGYAVTISGALSGFSSSGAGVRTIALGSGVWTLAGTGGWNTSTSTNLTVTGAGTISLTAASTKNFAGGGISCSGVTLNQGGAGGLTVSGDNTFANITNTYSATGATNINFNTTTQRLGNFTASGENGRVLTIQGSPCVLIHTSAGDIGIDYVTINDVRAYQI